MYMFKNSNVFKTGEKNLNLKYLSSIKVHFYFSVYILKNGDKYLNSVVNSWQMIK